MSAVVKIMISACQLIFIMLRVVPESGICRMAQSKLFMMMFMLIYL